MLHHVLDQATEEQGCGYGVLRRQRLQRLLVTFANARTLQLPTLPLLENIACTQLLQKAFRCCRREFIFADESMREANGVGIVNGIGRDAHPVVAGA